MLPSTTTGESCISSERCTRGVHLIRGELNIKRSNEALRRPNTSVTGEWKLIFIYQNMKISISVQFSLKSGADHLL
jgi:hypothetical protein